jgi:thioredoxin 1
MASDTILELSEANFEEEVVQSDKPVLVDFWAEWCMPCRMLAPTIEDLAQQFAGQVKFGKVDTESNRSLSIQFGIRAIPTVILFKDGQVVNTFIGVTSKKDFVAALTQLTS